MPWTRQVGGRAVQLEWNVMRRPDGALEDDIMRALWDADEPLLPAEILNRTGLELAYTSIATVLTRLLEKGLVHREPDGRAFRYQIGRAHV